MDIHFITTRPYSDKRYKEDLDRYEDFRMYGKQGRIDGWSARRTLNQATWQFSILPYQK